MACCPTDVKPKDATYTKRGDSVYITGSGPKGILYIPDIFGNTAQAIRVADMLAAKGFLVVIPDFFHGEAWDPSDMPPHDGWGGERFQGFIKKFFFPSSKPIVEQGVALLKALGATSIGALGFCAGGKVALSAINEGYAQAGASPHPSFFTVDDAKAVKGPFCILPTKDDTELLEVRDAFNEHPWAAKNAYHYFDDMFHGFCAARADFDNKLNAKRVNEAIEILATFFNGAL